MQAILLAAICAAQADATAIRVRLDRLTLKEAEQLNGRLVVAQLTVTTPATTGGNGKNLVTIVDTDGPDGAERSVYLRGNRLYDADRGAKLVVIGRLRVVRHPPSIINGVAFSGFTEIRVEE